MNKELVQMIKNELNMYDDQFGYYFDQKGDNRYVFKINNKIICYFLKTINLIYEPDYYIDNGELITNELETKIVSAAFWDFLFHKLNKSQKFKEQIANHPKKWNIEDAYILETPFTNMQGKRVLGNILISKEMKEVLEGYFTNKGFWNNLEVEEYGFEEGLTLLTDNLRHSNRTSLYGPISKGKSIFQFVD